MKKNYYLDQVEQREKKNRYLDNVQSVNKPLQREQKAVESDAEERKN